MKRQVAEGNKWCPGCQSEKPITDFGIANGRHDGKTGHCKVCHTKRTKADYEKRKAEGRLPKKEYKRQHSPEQAPRKLLDTAIREAIIQEPHLSQVVIAKRLKTTFEAVENMRRVLERDGTIPFLAELLTEKGRWRRRKAKVRIDPYGGKDFIYFIHDETGAIKIGFSNKGVYTRFRSLQTSNPRALTLLAVIPGGREKERKLHEMFAHCRIRDEWFNAADPKLQYLVNVMKERHGVLPIHDVVSECQKALESGISMLKYNNPYLVEGKKKCCRCQEVLPIEDFYAASNTSDGLRGACRTCTYKHAKEGQRSNTKQKDVIASLKSEVSLLKTGDDNGWFTSHSD